MSTPPETEPSQPGTQALIAVVAAGLEPVVGGVGTAVCLPAGETG